MTQALSCVIEVVNERGIHTRMATVIVKTANTFSSTIVLSSEKTKADAKSVMALLTLAAKKGTKLTLTVEGDDAVEAFEKLRLMIANGFPGVQD